MTANTFSLSALGAMRRNRLSLKPSSSNSVTITNRLSTAEIIAVTRPSSGKMAKANNIVRLPNTCGRKMERALWNLSQFATSPMRWNLL
jgi:hypothetical protein